MAGLMNSSPCLLIVKCYVAMHPSPHVMKYLRIPKYDPKIELHKAIAQMSFIAHDYKKINNAANINDTFFKIDITAAQLWNITKEELQEIQWNLSDLQSRGQAPPEEGEGDV